LDYTGSTTIEQNLMRGANSSPYEPVYINNMASAANGRLLPFPMIPVSFV
jgi:aspartate 1-decarboxylase